MRVRRGPCEPRSPRDGKKYIVGTANYVSPEQVAGRRVADSRSDLYSLGCVLLEMLTGVVPFCGWLGARDACSADWTSRRPTFASMRPEVPDEVASVLQARSMAVDPAERYLTAGQMADALGGALELLPVT